jgi:NhaA family Na+:H+ antiporter
VARSNKSRRERSSPSTPPGGWPSVIRGVRRVLSPVERFLSIEASSGILLMIAAGLALAWANSPWLSTYEHLWHTPMGFRLGDLAFERDLHFWINDGLMTIFFFVVGLEIRREIHAGELSEVRRAALPVAAALGGMIVPAIIFYSLNAGRMSAAGWAIPTATDIAFAVGALALLGRRVTPALRILLLALAVIDDVGAILVIAFFYSSNFVPLGFAVLGLGVLLILVLQGLGVRSTTAYVIPGIAIWAGAYIGGIHPTLAGVIIGFMTPVTAWYGAEKFLESIEARVQSLRSGGIRDKHDLLPQLKRMQVANREAVSPAERLQHGLHGWVAFGIMPVFAFANAGVPLRNISFSGDAVWVFVGVTAGLVIGKPIGILALSWLSARVGITILPHGTRWSHIAVVGAVGGIGFTMALFVAQLAFPSGALLETAKLAILCGSALAAVVSLVAGYRILSLNSAPDAAATDAEAEASTAK